MLCRLARQFPPFVELFLQQGSRLSRRFREETITDMLMSALIAIGSPIILVDYPNETTTGADMRWDFVNRQRGTFFSLFIQAKKLYDRAQAWRDHGYDELFHLTGSTGLFQAQVLCNYARNQPSTFPLHAFYNQGQSCSLARTDGITNVEGLTLADAYKVEQGVIAATTAPLRKAASSLGTLQPLFFALSDILCPDQFVRLGVMDLQLGAGAPPPISFGYVNGKPEVGFLRTPRPEDIRERLVKVLGRTSTSAESAISEVPLVAKTIPSEVVMRIIRHREGHFEYDERRTPYWTVTVVSTDPPSAD